MSLPAAHLAVLTALLVAASVWDVRRRRIPNLLSAAIAAAGLVSQTSARGWLAMLGGFAAGLAVIALLWHPWSRGRIGGGDVKVAGAAAMWVGPKLLLPYLLVTAVLGGVLGALCFVWSARAARREIAANLGLAATGLAVPEAPIRGGGGRVSVPYGVAVAAGALVVLWGGMLW